MFRETGEDLLSAILGHSGNPGTAGTAPMVQGTVRDGTQGLLQVAIFVTALL
jgi:hypothetical protein